MPIAPKRMMMMMLIMMPISQMELWRRGGRFDFRQKVRAPDAAEARGSVERHHHCRDHDHEEEDDNDDKDDEEAHNDNEEDKNDNLIVDKDYRQLWRKGTPNIEGYFTLENYQSKTFMTATSDVDLEVKGLISNLNFPVLHLKRLFFRNSAVLAVCSVIKGF